MPSDKEQKKSPEEEAEEKKYSFLQEKNENQIFDFFMQVGNTQCQYA